MADMSCLSVSLFIMALTCFLASVGRRVVQRMYRSRPLVRSLLLEGIATAELCGCCFELIVGEWAEGASYETFSAEALRGWIRHCFKQYTSKIKNKVMNVTFCQFW